MAREKPTFEELEKKVQALESSEARRKKAEKKLVKKEALLNEILRLTKVGGWEYDIDTGETVWTDEVYRIHELPVDHNIDHMSMSVKCYQAEDRPLIQKAFKQAVEKGKPYDLELKFITAKGNPRWVRTTAKASRKGSKVVRVFGNIEDITERKQVAESLRESEDRLQLAMDAGEHGFWDFNVDTGDVFFSPRYYTMLGYEPGELPRRLETWIDLMHPEDRKTIVPEILQYVENAEPYAVDFRLKCKDGSYKWISGRGKSFQIDDKGIPHRAVGVHVDITERKLAEEALRKSEQILDSIMVNVPDIIYRLDADGKFLFVSDSVGQYGYSPVELLGTSVFDIVHPEDHEKAVYRVNERRTGDRRTISMELRLLTKDQNAVSFEVKSNSFKDAPIFLVDAGGMYSTDEEGEKSFLCTQGIARDISERKKVYREKENLENQLRQAQKMESVGR
ncbi:MAG: PAS domain-containing protein, partial [Chloroflexi bacterium]|nr:PAS domain-containing protein [Chloroflexota bacterium]